MKARLFLFSLSMCACTAQPSHVSPQQQFKSNLSSLEGGSGGRLGVALVNGSGQLVGGHRVEERFAFCSTFKLLLAGMVLEGAGNGNLSLDEQLPLAQRDFVFHSPVTELHADAGFISIRQAARAIVVEGDNTAANLLVNRLGGTTAFNGWLRHHGDRTTRLDRLEPSLNENGEGDERDTTSPGQIARTASSLLFAGGLRPDEQELLRGWLLASETGRNRIRAGLPSGMIAGDKTGTCGAQGRESYNDVAFIIPSPRVERGYVLAVFLDRPNSAAETAESTIAEVARSAVAILGSERP